MYLVYLLVLLAVMVFFTLPRYRNDFGKAARHAAIWIAIFLGLFIVVKVVSA